jgi:hypothetical protein
MMRINRPEGRTADLSTPLRGTGGVMGLRPTQGDEKRLLSEAALPWERRPTLVISTEAQRRGEISVLTPLPGNVF